MQNTLLVYTNIQTITDDPAKFKEDICDVLIDAIIDYDIYKIVTLDTSIVYNVIVGLCYDSNTPYEQYRTSKEKYGSSTLSRILWEATSKSTHVLLINIDEINSEFSNLLYFIERNNVIVINANI